MAPTGLFLIGTVWGRATGGAGRAGGGGLAGGAAGLSGGLGLSGTYIDSHYI